MSFKETKSLTEQNNSVCVSAMPSNAFKKLLMQINTLTMSSYSVLIYWISLHLFNTLFTALSCISLFISLSCQGIMFLGMSVCQLLRWQKKEISDMHLSKASDLTPHTLQKFWNLFFLLILEELMVSGHNNPRAIHHIASFLPVILDDTMDVFIVASSFAVPCGLHSSLIFQRFSFRMQ